MFVTSSCGISRDVAFDWLGSVVFTLMDIVVRTPHGDADVSIVAHTSATTLGDVLAMVTGQAVPRLALIDGHTIDATTPLDDAGLVAGAVVDAEPGRPTLTSDDDIEVAQVAGPGAGRLTRLAPGRYRFGPGRRSSADELDLAPVEQAMFEIVVTASTAGSSEVTVVAEGTDVALDGTPVTSPMPWRDRTLTAGSRAFQLSTPEHAASPRTLPVPDHDGVVAFSRPPRRRSAPDRRPVVDALRDATHAAPTLWERRPDHPDAFALPFGLCIGPAGPTIISADLDRNRAVGIAGADRVRSALARTLIVEATTLHGPADLGLVILTSPDRAATWDWTKWLPHLRLGGSPAVWSSVDDVRRWVDVAGRHAVPDTMPSPASHLTMVVVDDPTLWNRRDALLRPVLANPPDDLRLIALCDDAIHAPSICTTLITDTGDDLVRLHSLSGSSDIEGIRPALTEIAIAVRVARALAPLADVELALPEPAAPTLTERVELSELIDLVGPEEVLARWSSAVIRTTAPVGRADDQTVDVSLGDDVTAIFGSSMGDAFDVAATLLLAQCSDRSPSDLWVVPLGSASSPRADLLSKLPHATERPDTVVGIEPPRLLTRLRSVLAQPDGPARVVLVVDVEHDVTTPSPHDPSMLAALADGVRAVEGLSMIVVGNQPVLAVPEADTLISVERRDTAGSRTAHRVATITTLGDGGGRPFTPLQPAAAREAALELRPAVIGRALTPLERRLEQRRIHAVNVPNPDVAAAVEVLRVAASQLAGDVDAPRRVALPPPLPTHLDLDLLLASTPGDGVPLGVADDPSQAGARTHWWEPGTGSLLLYGSRRSGIEQVLTTVLLGITDRFVSEDVRLVVIEPSSTKRRAVEHLGRDVTVVAPDQADAVLEALDAIATHIGFRESATDSATDGPRPVLLIADLVQLRRLHADRDLGDQIDDVLVAATAPDSGVDVIAYASELDGAGPFAAAATSRLIGASSNREELATLGVDRADELDGVAGRCRSFPGNDLVQLAMADTTAEALLERRGGSE